MDLPAGAYGVIPTVASPFLFDGERAAPSASAPALGEHTEEVLREAGMSRRRSESCEVSLSPWP